MRAHPFAEHTDEFRTWFRGVHPGDARKIPGIAQIEMAETAAGTFLALYSFDGAEAVQVALASPQAAYARGTIEQWTAKLEELQIEMFTPLGALPIFSSRN
jgi:hypothetical protein